jgi:hypothetical protein
MPVGPRALRLYSFEAEVESKTIEVYIGRIRKKLGHDFIETIRGMGCRLGQLKRAARGKYLPLNRLSEIYARECIELSVNAILEIRIRHRCARGVRPCDARTPLPRIIPCSLGHERPSGSVAAWRLVRLGSTYCHIRGRDRPRYGSSSFPSRCCRIGRATAG